MSYVINRETDEVHKEGCPWIKQIKPRNRRTISRVTDKTKRDYSACGHCKPWQCKALPKKVPKFMLGRI